jgi:hypothetical protein
MARDGDDGDDDDDLDDAEATLPAGAGPQVRRRPGVPADLFGGRSDAALSSRSASSQS